MVPQSAVPEIDSHIHRPYGLWRGSVEHVADLWVQISEADLSDPTCRLVL